MAFNVSVVNRSQIDAGEAVHIGVADVRQDVFEPAFIRTVLQNPKVVEVIQQEAGSQKYELLEVILVVRGRL